MAHLWNMDPLASEPTPLAGSAVALGAASAAADSPARTLLVNTDATGDAWCLVAGAGADVIVNGEPVATGVRALRDRDEIRIPREDLWCFFGTERRATLATYTGSEPTPCPRCRQPIAPDAPAVRCPACGLWHHQSDALSCWQYADTCAMCAQRTALDAGWRWTPEEL